jgi:immunity protein, SdpI family
MKRKYFLTGIILTAAALMLSVILYPSLPDRIPTHWNLHGEVDGYGSKSVAAFLGPGLMAMMLLLFRFLPWLSPHRFEVADTERPTYLYIMVVIVVLIGYIHAVSIAAAMGWAGDVGRAMVGGIFLFFALLGNVLGKVPRNFYIGVRTPWTIASERVWHATHRLAARVFVLAGTVGFILVILMGWFVVSFLILMVALIVPVAFSLVYYKRLQRQGRA